MPTYKGKHYIDIFSPDGNAHVIIAHAMNYAHQLGKSKNERAELRKEMMSGDYKHLMNVFQREFPFCELIGYEKYAKDYNNPTI